MAASVIEQKCPQCGGVMHFDIDSQKLVCDYCGYKTVLDPKKIDAGSAVGGFNFKQCASGFANKNAKQLPIYNCLSCGAELIAPPEQIATTCPYCRNHVVLSDKISGNLRPNGIIPFKVRADELPKLLTRFYSDQKLMPKRFFTDASMSGVTGVYVPFWLFSGKLTGEVSFIGSKTTTRMEGTYRVTTTSYYEFKNAVQVTVRDVPVDASDRIDDKLMDSIEPFDLTEAVPFDIGYLAGYTADRFDTPAKDMEQRILRRLTNTADRLMDSRSKEFFNVRRVKGTLSPELDAKYYLLPVYLFHMKYHGKSLRYAVNGQTGEVIGEPPIDVGIEGTKHFLKRFVLATGAILACFIVKYFMGG